MKYIELNKQVFFYPNYYVDVSHDTLHAVDILYNNQLVLRVGSKYKSQLFKSTYWYDVEKLPYGKEVYQLGKRLSQTPISDRGDVEIVNKQKD